MTEKEKELLDGVTFSVVGDLVPTSIVEGKVEDADYIAYVLWVPRTKLLIFKIWNKDGSIADPAEDYNERFPFKIEPYRGPGTEKCGNIYNISISLRQWENSSHKINYYGHPIYPAIKCIILDLIRLTNDGHFATWC